ncbi:MAG TPA: spore maturation protein [Clostridiales bacterium]|jgi:spore maturation protein A|nr:spore maturation protein [Clostridiales bacterium]
MMNAFWGIIIFASLLFGLIAGQKGELITALITGANDAVILVFNLAGAYMVWMGLMEVANDMGVVKKLSNAVQPLLKKLFPKSKSAVAPITLNLAANFFGLGSAATPFGIKAMQELQKYNPHPAIATTEMCMFIALNASALELLPTTVLSMRAAAASNNVYIVVVPTFIASIAAFATAVLCCKFFESLEKRKGNC